MLNCVLIGAGFIAQNHADALVKNQEINVVGVICRNPEHATPFVEKFGKGCSYYSSLEAACAATKVDFVDICVPTNLHEEYTIKAAGLGCHVLCEKPVTFTLESYDRMMDAVNKAGVKFMVAQVVRFSGETAKLKELLSEDRLGKIHMFYIKRLCQHPTWDNWHRNVELSGGGLYDLNVHDIDNLYYCFGMPETVYATGWKSPTECWNHVVTSLTWADGVRAVCETSLEMTGNFPFSAEIRGTGDKGTVEYSYTAGVNINDSEAVQRFTFYETGKEEPEPVKIKETDAFASEVNAFVDAILGRAQIPIKSEEVRDVLRIILATKKSLEENVVVKI